MADTSHSLLFLSQREVIEAGVLNMEQVVPLMEKVYGLHWRGETVLPSKGVIRWGGVETEWEKGRINALPGWIGGDIRTGGIKWIAVSPEGVRAPGMPKVAALVIINDPVTLYPVAIMDGVLLSAIRTGANMGAAALQVLKDRAHILTLMGNSKEACEAYEIFNTYKDSLDAMNYIRQINELHTLYQIDKNELDNLNRQKTILYWSWFTILSIVILIVFFILLVRRGNKKLRQSQQELEKVKKQEENSIRTKSLFLSNMSHEIRTPLNALSGFSSILTEESIDNETRKQCSDIIQQNSELLLKLINDVIDLSSLEVGKMKFKYERCDAVAICRNVIDMVEKIKQTNANVRFSTSLHSLELTTDNARLQQLLINLLINATKFTPQGSITMELEKQTEDIALFSVTDTGCGISPENQNKIFNRFEKLNENAQGTGLGLSICQLIIEQLGGKIWIDSNYEEGARFLFTHPIYHEQQGKEEAE